MWSSTTPSPCMSSSIWTIHQTTNGLTSRFHLRASTPPYPFQHAPQWNIWGPLCPNFIMFWPKGRRLVYNLICIPNLSIIFSIFLHNTSYATLITHPLMIGIPWCVCTHPIDPMGIHLLHYVHGNECTWTHDAIRDTFAAIMQDVGFHMGWK